jgi:WD domain, G-beta repeat/WD40-like Beta Propeller Repeat
VGRAPAEAHCLPSANLGQPDRVQPEWGAARGSGDRARYGHTRRPHGGARQAPGLRGSLGRGGLLPLRRVPPDGDLLFVGQYDGTGRLFSTETWRPVGQPLKTHTARITFPEFTPDGRTLVTAAADGTVVLWDVETQKPIGSPLELAPNTFASAALSPDGSRLYAISTRGEGISFNMSPEAWKRHACVVAGRELTAAGWDGALPERPYQAVCSDD